MLLRQDNSSFYMAENTRTSFVKLIHKVANL